MFPQNGLSGCVFPANLLNFPAEYPSNPVDSDEVNDSQKTDAELVDDFKHGDVRGFNELVRRYQQRVYWIARRMVNNHQDADDITQDVFVRVYESLRRFRGEASFYTWLYRIATNVSLNAVRKLKVREALSLEDVSRPIVDDTGGPDELLHRKDMNAMLEQAIAKLPARQKLVFTMRYHEEMPYEEMAKILKRSVGGLKANYFHAVKKVQAYITNRLSPPDRTVVRRGIKRLL